MKYICKDVFIINDNLIGRKGDMLEITDAVPMKNESLEDVAGCCDIKNLSTNIMFFATWNDVDDTLEIIE